MQRRCITAPGRVVAVPLLALLLPALAQVSAQAVEPPARAARGWTDPNCGGCHRVDPLFSHPVGEVASMPVPDRFPLDGGRIACTTCHRDERAADHREARSSGGSLLRKGAASCVACHRGSASRRSRMHGEGGGRAHLRWPGRDDVANEPARAGIVRCLGCHDGTVGPDIGLHRQAGLERGETGHPVDVEYRALSSRRRRPLALRPRAGLDDRIRLPEGRVACISCHSPFSRERGLLVMPNTGSRLCLGCHDM